MSFTTTLVDVLKAKFPLLYVETHEEGRVVNENCHRCQVVTDAETSLGMEHNIRTDEIWREFK